MRTEDNPNAVLAEQMEAAAFQIQPYHWPVIGWMQDIERFTIDDLRAYRKTHYSPGNAIIVLVGDFKKEAVLPLIEQAFSPIPSAPLPDQQRDLEQPQLGERRVIVRREAQLASVVRAYHVPNLKDPDAYVLEVIESLLSAGESSRLNRVLVRDKQLALSADANNQMISKDPNLFTVSAEVMPSKTVDQVERALDGEIEALKQRLVDARELEKAKNQLESSFVFSQDSLFYQGMLLANYEIVSSWRDVDRYIPSVRAVSAEDVRRVASKYLVTSNCTTGILIPIPSTKQKLVTPGSPAKENIVR